MENLHCVTFLSLLCNVFIFRIDVVIAKDVAGSCMGRERQALIEFKGSLIDNANRLSSWMGDDCCSWVGITCNNLTSYVEKVDLHNPVSPFGDWDFGSDSIDDYSNNCLGGEINHSICNLEYLQYLDLSFNDFSGIMIPTCFGSLKNLRYLNLSTAGFNGEIPNHLGNLSNLQYLDVGDSNLVPTNSLTAMSLKWITGFASLEVLDLSGTNLNKSLDWLNSINMLPFLSSLSLRDCQLAVATISPSLFQFNLTSLVSLDMGSTELNSFPSILRFFNLTASKLEVLRLDGNHFQGSVPFVLEKFTSLTVLDLSSNSFNSLMMLDSLCNHTSLVYLDLSNNQFGGSIHPCAGNLTSLEVFYLANNQFGGNIPKKLGQLKQLTHLDLSRNSFRSCIPSSFGKLTNLKLLYLHDNLLYGTVPSNIGKLTKLEELDISYNSLTGELSEFHFRKLKCLKVLFLSKNQFLRLNVSSQWIPPFQLSRLLMVSVRIGTQFPPWLQTQRNLFSLSMKNASISGAIPEWFGTMCSSLNNLDLSFNFLTGTLESLGTNCSNLQILNLSNNMIHGSSSGSGLHSLCDLSSLEILHLGNNRLTGTLPPCLGNMESLGLLNLANNGLSGHIPTTVGNLDQLNYLQLNGNKFSGVLPPSLKKLKWLIILDLGENHLTDIIPDWIGKELSGLMFLRLESNKFYGNISSSLCKSPSLQLVNLAHNNLGGKIPHCLGNLSGMLQRSHLDLPFPELKFYTDVLLNMMKGMGLEYTSSNIWFLKSISLSGNHIHGEIPKELMYLDGLQSLNLSNNNLSGKIPDKIGNLKQLESLDLSTNQLSGPVPQSLATIDALSYLNLSFNNLEGRIPSGNHFDTLNDPSIYEGNSGLCGKPLAKRCPGDDSPNGSDHYVYGGSSDDDSEFELQWFYAGLAPGFTIGWLGVVCVLVFKKTWRHAYFEFLENVYSRVWVAFAVKIPHFQRRFN